MPVLARLLKDPTDKIAVVTGEAEISQRRLASDVMKVASFLRVQGIGPGSVIGIYFGLYREEGDYPSWVSHLAAMLVGATHASIYDARSLSDLLGLTRVDAVIGRLPKLFPNKDAPKVIPVDIAALPEAGAPKDDEASAKRLNLTSGTTGRPKLVEWDSDTISARVQQVAELGLIDEQTCLNSYLAPRTTAGFRYPIATWLAGGRVLLCDGRALSGRERAKQSTLVICSPIHLQRLRSRAVSWPNRQLRTIVALGGRVAAQLRDWALANIASKVIISYGSTETGNIAHGDAMAVDRHPGAVGWIREDAEVSIIGPGGKPVGFGEMGRLRIRTPHLVSRTESAAQSDSGWFEPGDMAVRFEDGLLAIAGRAADVFNVGGVKISASDLESRLLQIDEVADAAAGGVSTPKGDILWIAFVPRQGIRPMMLGKRIRRDFAGGLPARVVAVRSIPRNAMGKVNRRELLDRMTRAKSNRRVKRENA